MKHSIRLIVLVLILSSLLAACAAPAPTSAPVVTEAPATEAPVVETAAPTEAPTEVVVPKITITDALDRSVEFEELPTRVVIAGKAGFMIANAAFLFPEARERVIAYVPGGQTPNDFVSMIFPEAANMTQVESGSGVEQLAPLNPDVVLLKSYLKTEVGDPLEQAGIKVLYLDLETAEAINKDITMLGALFGNSARAEEIVALNVANSARVTDAVKDLTAEEKPTVLMLQYSDKGGEIAFKVPPLDWLQASLITMAGGVPVWSDVPTDGWTTITLEQIAVWNPQTILLINYKGNAVDVVAQLKADSAWALLDAVKNNSLYAFPLDFQSWDQPDTRWTLGLTWVAIKLHPDVFSDVNMMDEVMRFYQEYYGLDEATITEIILPLVKGDL